MCALSSIKERDSGGRYRLLACGLECQSHDQVSKPSRVAAPSHLPDAAGSRITVRRLVRGGSALAAGPRARE
jgi:hypothetical protein